MNRFFVDEHIRDLYAADLKQAQIFALFAGVAVLLACLGLFGLSASTTERRVREIGLRKAMGASSGDVMRLLLWQFTQPVLWASLLAWPVVGWLMNRWLDGFAYRIDLELWVFVMATVSAIFVASLRWQRIATWSRGPNPPRRSKPNDAHFVHVWKGRQSNPRQARRRS